MHTRNTLAVLAATVGLVCGVTGCASSSTPASTSSTHPAAATSLPVVVPSVTASAYPTSTSTAQPRGLPGGPRGVNTSSSLAVATRFLQMSYSQDTVIDDSPWDALKRASVLATPSYAAQVLGSPPVAAPGAQWNLWAAHHAYTRVTLTRQPAQDEPAPTSASAFYTFVVHVAVVGVASTVAPVTVFVHVTRANTDVPWTVASLTVASA